MTAIANIEAPLQRAELNPHYLNKESLYRKSLDFRNWDGGKYGTLNTEALSTEGITDYKDLSGFKTAGIEVVKHEKISEQTLKLQRYGKIGATVGAVALNAGAALGLFYSGAKLLLNSVRNNDVEDSYKSLGNAYSASAVAGALTGAAHESAEWSLGNIGMGVFSRYLDSIWGLAGFSISEGLSSIGMGQVRYRDKQNVYAVRNSIFNNPSLSKFRFLMPIEQSIISFTRRLLSPKDWQRFKKEEPYSLFQTSGGGLISAGGLLGIASIFKNKMSEKLQSFFYLPYSLFSVANLIALYRDGEVMLTRAKDFGARKAGELFSMKMEGNLKKLAAPFLGLNNLFLGLKGLGIDSDGGMMYNLAMAMRSWGAGLAFLAFKSQSLLKFFKPDMFGPQFKEIIELNLNPSKAGERVLEHLDNLETKRPAPHMRDKFDAIIYDDDNEQREILDLLINTETFKGLQNKTQVGLPTPSNPPTNGRPYLERYSHSKRVCAVAILIYNALLKNTTDEGLRNMLLENKDAFKLAGLLHDVGHIARSHLAEKAVKGHNNDEYTVEILKGTSEDAPKDIHNTVIEYYGKERGEKILAQTREIIGKWSPLFKAFKIADYTEYTRCGDFTCVDGFTKWSLNDVKEYADTVRLYKDEGGKVKTCFTEKGSLLTFKILFDRKIFNDSFNYFPISNAEELPYLLGLDAADLSAKDIKRMTEREIDASAKKGLSMLKNANFQFRLKHMTGGETAYCGYSKVDPERKILVYTDERTEPMEFLDYLETVIKPKDKELYDDVQPMVNGLITPKEVKLVINVSSNGD